MKYTPFFTAISRLLAVFLCSFVAIPHHLHSQGLFDDFQFIAHDSDVSVPLLVADLEGDGDADFITATAFFLDTDYWCNIVWYENLGAGVFGTMKELYSYQGVPTISISIADMDNDGDNDLLYSSDNIYWIAQSGSQVFEELHYIETGTYFKEFLPIDMDNDNDIDIMPVNTSGVNMIWFRNNLSDNWELEIKNTLMNLGNHYITPCDFDQDGDVDFTCIAQTMAGPDLTYKKLIYKNNGAGSLQGIYAGGSNYSYQGLISTNGDIDNDGYTDYICSHQSDGKITWLQNNGLGNCNEEAVLLIEAGIKPIAALSDLDGDEDLDLLLKSNEKGVIWFQNKNEGNFEWVEEIFAEPLQYIHTVDLDNDGDKEVIGLYWSDNNPQIGNGIVWFDNLNTQPSVKAFAFYDHNANGIKDENDFFVDNQLFTITPAALGFYSNTAGVSQFYLEEGNYTLHYNVPEAYHLSSDSTDYHFEVLPTNNAPLYYYFGITPNDTSKFSLSAFITASPLICNNEVAYQIIVRNQSAFPLDSILLQCNYASDLILSSSLPTTDSIENNQLFWDVSQLLPFESKSIIVNFTAPNFNAMGDTLQVSAIPYFVNYDQNPLLIAPK
ncbi:MAG: VCBS repeat-containing protein [Sphingobacteriales bacterium]|nr:VCBS repeat-containing protein [Sphingobacteriales bacterium]